MDYRYSLDPEGNLTTGDTLRFAYSGAGIATLIDRDGKGYKVPLEQVEALPWGDITPIAIGSGVAEAVASVAEVAGLPKWKALDEPAILETPPADVPSVQTVTEPVKRPAPAFVKRGPGRPRK